MNSATATERRDASKAARIEKSGATQRAYSRRDHRVQATGESRTSVLPRQRGTVVVSRIPFVATIIGLLGCGLALTLLLTTRSAEESYQLSDARLANQQLINQRATLQREVESADSAPELAAAAAKLGMIPAKDPAHLVVGPDGTVVVIGKAKPASGGSAPLLNPVLPLTDPNGIFPGRLYPDRTVPNPNFSILQAGTDIRAQGEQLVQVPVGSLESPAAVAAQPQPPVNAPVTPSASAPPALAPGSAPAAAGGGR